MFSYNGNIKYTSLFYVHYKDSGNLIQIILNELKIIVDINSLLIIMKLVNNNQEEKGAKMTDTFELEKQIRKNGFTKKQIANELGLSEQGLLLKMQNKTEFKASEIEKLCNLLKLKSNAIFFRKKVN